MASSFDSVEQDEWQQIAVPDVDFFSVVTDLYGQYRANNPKVRGTAVRHGQVEELPLDFCISVECALVRAGLTPRERTLYMCFSANGIEAVNKCLPTAIKKMLQDPFKTIYHDFPRLVEAAFHARDVQQVAEARKAKLVEYHANHPAQREAILVLSNSSSTEIEAVSTEVSAG